MLHPRFFSLFAGSAGNNDTYEANLAHAAETDYYITPPLNSRFEVARLLVSVYDTKGFEPEEYGAGTALAAGIQVIVERLNLEGVLEEEVITPEAITQMHQWGHYCYDLQLQAWDNSSNQCAAIRWTFAKSRAPIVLKYGERLIVRCLAGCNCAHLLAHHFVFQRVDTGYAD